MPRKIIVLFDGTWNNAKSGTNVTRMRDCIASSGTDDPLQPCYYHPGVGTHWFDRLSGGAFGRGLSENIRDAYLWFCQNYRPGDELYVFGFSRGAYSARSFVGLIRKCGVLQAPSAASVARAYDLYRDKDAAPDGAVAVAFREANSIEIRVHFIGVWDTVGALGIPVSHVPFGRDYYRWHDTELSKIVDYAYHAIATDEHREDYNVAVWTKQKPENVEVEQRWFVGAHSNVGGGNPQPPVDCLPNPPLRWIQDKAAAAGLKLRDSCEVGKDDCLETFADAYRKFIFGVYRWFKRPYYRKYGAGVNETVDASVWTRWRADTEYRPPSLQAHKDRPPAAVTEKAA